MSETFYDLIDGAGETRLRARFSPAVGGSLPDGWTADNPDPGVLDGGGTGTLANAAIDTGGSSINTGSGDVAVEGGTVRGDDGTTTFELKTVTGLEFHETAEIFAQHWATESYLEDTTGAFITIAPAQSQVLNIKPKAGAAAINVVAALGPDCVIDPNGVALLRADQQQALDPSTCTPEDIANALIALGIAKAS